MFTQGKAIQEAREAGTRFVKTCRAATDAEWRKRLEGNGPAWSTGDIAEHVTIANGNILRRLQGMGQHPLNGKLVSVEDVEVPYLFYRGGDEPPNVAPPTGLMHNDRSAFAAFEDGIKGLERWFEASTLDLRTVGAPHPVFGLLDGVQWLLFCAAHTERHRAQVIGLLRPVEPR